jgi:hypothetical protein
MRFFKDPKLQARFDSDGYVLVDLMSAGETRELRKRARALMPQVPKINDAQDALYVGHFDCDERRQAIDDFVSAEFFPIVAEYLDGQAIQGGSLMAKIPRSVRLPIHQHRPSIADIYQSSVNFWCTLDDLGLGRGALRIVPNSHRITRHVKTFESEDFFRDFSLAMEDRFAVTVPMRAGQGIFFDNSLLHGSEPNESSDTLLRIFILSCPEHHRFVDVKSVNDGHFEAIELGSRDENGKAYSSLSETNRTNNGGLIDNRQERLSEAEFAALLRSSLKIAPGFDPIDKIRDGFAEAPLPFHFAKLVVRTARRVRSAIIG